MKSQKTIELNGNLYDAVTGKIIGSGNANKPAARSGHNIDGFFRSRSTTVVPAAQKISVLAAPKHVPAPAHHMPRATPNHARAHQPQSSVRVAMPKTTSVSAISKPAAHNTHVTVNHAKAHKPQSAVTLMRTAVKRPHPSVRAQANAQGSLAHQVPGLIEVKRAAAAIDTDRLVRASSVETSPMIAHHGKQVAQVAVGVAPLQVKPVPVPVKPAGNMPPAIPAPQQNPKQNIFDHALANASNFRDVREHRAHFRKQAGRHVASMAAGTLALFVIALFAFFQNSPSLQVKFASVKAGVATNVPNFAAAGFAYNGVHGDSGKVVVGFKDGSGSYQLSQQATNWSGSEMIQDVSAVDATGQPNYTTVNAAGTTVYRFTNTGATWVSNGKWYSVTGSNVLSNDQVKSIVENV
jgi:hypothetical protein